MEISDDGADDGLTGIELTRKRSAELFVLLRDEDSSEASTGSDLSCRFYMDAGQLTIRLGVGVDHEVAPDYDSFAWQVLTTLATSASAETVDGEFTISLTMESGHPEIGL